jgi:glc operon protein GlcG
MSLNKTLGAVAAAGALAAGATQAQTPTPAASPAPAYGAPISLTEAQTLIQRAVEASRARGFRMSIAVVEPSGELVAFAKMDDTQYGSTHVAQRKAETSARYRTSTASFESRVMGGRVVTLGNDDVMPIAGGQPIIVDGKVVGGLGVSGGTPVEDDEIAVAALARP